MIVVSAYSMGGHISHTYTDHVSTLKFIERNWWLPPITDRSRDNLPNPVVCRGPLRSRQFAGDRRPVRYVRLRLEVVTHPGRKTA